MSTQDPTHEIRRENSLSADIHESVAGENIVGRGAGIRPGTDTASVEVDPEQLAAYVFALPEDAEYDTVWLHARESDDSLALTDHRAPTTPPEGGDPPEDGVRYVDVVDWSDDSRPNQTLVACQHLVAVFNELEHGRIDSLTVHVDDAGLVAFDSPGLDEGYLVAPQFTSDHPEVSKSDVADLRDDREVDG